MKPVLLAISLFLIAEVGTGSSLLQDNDHSTDRSQSDTVRAIEQRVQQLLADEQTEDDEAASTIFELDHRAVPVLVAALQEDKTVTRAARSLAYIGGPEERKILLAAVKSEKNSDKRLELSVLLAGALVQPASKEEWAFLENSIQRKKEGRDAVLAFSAALALGMNGSHSALQLLQKEEVARPAADTSDDSAKEIATAIQWIKHKRANSNTSSSGSDSEKITKIVLANAFYAQGDSDQPSVERTVFTKDKTRALATVQIYHGPKNAQGYDVVLQKSEGVWKIVGIWFSWAA